MEDSAYSLFSSAEVQSESPSNSSPVELVGKGNVRPLQLDSDRSNACENSQSQPRGLEESKSLSVSRKRIEISGLLDCGIERRWG